MANKSKIEINKTKNNQKIINVIAGNGENLLTSETLKTAQAVKKSLAAIVKAIPNAVVIDNTLPKPTKPIKKPTKK